MIKAVEDQGGHSINDQLFDLGLEKDMMEDEDVMMQWIKKIDQEFDQVLLLEYFEEGLILMAESLCWPLEHVTIFRILKLSTPSKRTNYFGQWTYKILNTK